MTELKKPRILLIADVPGWIFERHCFMLMRYLSDDFAFSLSYDGEPFQERDFDLVYPLEWYKVKPEQMSDPSRYVSAIRSHLVWPDQNFHDLVQHLSGHFNLIHTVSRRLHDIFFPHLSNVRYVSHGVDTSLFTPTTTCDQSGVGLRLGWAGNRKSVGRKGFAEFIEPLGRVPGVELVFCGYSDRNLSLTEMQLFYDSLDAYVCASDLEGNNNSLMEAAAMARAIITTDNGTVPEYLEHDRSALIVARDLRAFIRSVIDLRDNPAKRRRLGEEARKAVLRHWKWEDRAEDYRRFFLEALERSAHANCRDEAAKGKVLIACTHFWPSVGGVETMAENLGGKLVEEGYTVHVATLSHPERTAEIRRGMKIITLDREGNADGASRWPLRLRKLVTSGDYLTCILLADPLNEIIWSLENSELPRDTRLLIQPVINADGYRSWRGDKEFRRRLAAILRKGTTLSLTLKGVDNGFFSEEGITPIHIPNAVAPLCPAFNFRKEYGIHPSAFLILHVANLWRVKNHTGMLRAIGDLPEEYHLVLIGYRHGDDDYMREVDAELSRHPKVTFIPGLPAIKVAAAMKSADLVVLASHGEVAPVCILEAMSYGVAWLATPDCGTVSEQAGGLVLPLEKFRDAILFLKGHPDACNKLGQLGYRNWKLCFSWEVVFASWVEVMETGTVKMVHRLPEDLLSEHESLTTTIINALSPSAAGSQSTVVGAKRTVTSMGLDTRASSEGGGGSPLLPGAATDAGTGASPVVSVIVPTYNRPHELKAALRSILDQTFQDFQIIVVNDAGADVSSIVKELGDGRIWYFSHESNKGLAAARNTGIRASSGKFIAYLDDDDVYYADHLETLVAFMKSGGEKGAYTDAYRAHQALQPDGSYLISKRDLPYSHDFDYRQILVGNFIPVLCIMHEASCLEETGGYDEELAAHEDWDLWIRLSRKFSFHHIKKVTCEFRWREDGTSMTSSKELDFISTQEAIYRKYSHLCKEMPEVRELQRSSLLGRKKAAESMIDVCCTIIIPVFNQLQYTARCLDALYSVTPFRCRFEVVVVDNASTDGTPSYLQQASRLYPNLRFIRNEQNLLFAGACNMGAQAARGEVLVFLNNDTEPEPQWLEQLLAPLECDAVGLVGAKLLYPDRTVQHGGMVFVACAPVPEGIFCVHRFRGTAEDDARINNPEELLTVTGACFAIRKELFNAVGGISTEYGMYYEDVDLCLKVRKTGKKVYYQPRSVLIHHEGKSSSTEAAVELDAQARRIFLKKWRRELLALIQGDQRFAGSTVTEQAYGRALAERAQAAWPKTAGKILWVRPDSIGDNVLAAAMLPYLKSAAPGAKVTVVCQQHVAELYESSPCIDAVISFDKLRAFQDESYRKVVVSKIRSEQADLALSSVYSRDPISDLFTIGSGAAERVGFEGNLCNITPRLRDENNRGYTALLQSEGEWKPELERHRDFLRGMGMDAPPLQPVIWTTPEDDELADGFFRGNGWRPDRCLVLFAGAQAGERRYPHYGRALAGICREGGFTVVAVGTAEEFSLNQENLDDCAAPAINMCGQLSLRQTAALLKRCRLAVGAETGTAHMACAVGTPNVVLVGGGHFSRFMPYSPLTSVVCLPLACYCCNWRCSFERAHCVKDLHPDVIAEAVRQTLSGPCDRIRVFCESRDSRLPMPGEPEWKGCENLLVHYPVQFFYPGKASQRGEGALASMTVTEASSVAPL